MSSKEREEILKGLYAVIEHLEDKIIQTNFLSNLSSLQDRLNISISSGLARKVNGRAKAVIGTDIENYTLPYEVQTFSYLPNLTMGILNFDLEQVSVYFPSDKKLIPLDEILFHHVLPEKSKTREGLYKTPLDLLKKYEATKWFTKILEKVKNCVLLDRTEGDFYKSENIIHHFLGDCIKINYEKLPEAPDYS